MTCPVPSRTSASRRPGCARSRQTYPGPCLAHLSEAPFFQPGSVGRLGRRARPAGDLTGADTDRPLDLARAHARSGPGPGLPRPVAPAQAHVGAARAAAERFAAGPGGGLRRDGGRCCFCAGDLAGYLPRQSRCARPAPGCRGRPGIFNWRAIEADTLIGLGRLTTPRPRSANSRRVPGGRAGMSSPAPTRSGATWPSPRGVPPRPKQHSREVT